MKASYWGDCLAKKTPKDPHWAEPSYGWWAKRLASSYYENFLERGGRPESFSRWAELNKLPIKKKDAQRLSRGEVKK